MNQEDETLFQEDGIPCLTQRSLVPFSDWHLLVGCLMLNRTTRRQARAALDQLFRLAPWAQDLEKVTDEQLLEILRPCGFGNRRAVALRNLTEDFLKDTPLRDIRHCGPYAWDSFEIFSRGKILDPESVGDSELKAYLLGVQSGLYPPPEPQTLD